VAGRRESERVGRSVDEVMKGVLLSGGEGTRLRPITHTGPKQLVPVANKPVIQYAVEDLREAGITEIGVILGNKGRAEIQEFLGDGTRFGVEITYIVQGEPYGLAHAVGCAEAFVGDDDFVTYLGDNILKSGIADLVDSFEAGEYTAGIALQHVDNPEQFGIARIVDGAVAELVEKPDDPDSDLAVIGVYVFSPAIFDAIEAIEPSDRGELEITDAMQHLLERGEPFDAHVVEGWWKDTGKPEDILAANRLVLDDLETECRAAVDPDARVEGAVDAPPSARIEADAVVRGPVSLAENVTIRSGTYVGPYTSIGADSEVARAHVENSVVVGESTVATEETVVDSLIGRGTTVESAADELPRGRRLVVGENSRLKL
jgi:glucose-1-phosphate thymidylyltransferase